MRLRDRVALITGASRGIGRATALLFADEGASVVVNYFASRTEAEAVVKEIKGKGGKATAIRCDVSQETEVAAMIDRTVHQFGNIDILVNNAGLVFDVPLLEKSIEQWLRTLEVNLLGTFLCSKYAASIMMLSRYGRIINVSSTSAIHSFSPDIVDYDASKAGVIALTKNLAKALAPVINVNAVAPGWVETDMSKGLASSYIESEISKIYLKRFAQPQELAKAILFLAGDDASYITGSVLVVDGGHD